MSNSLRAKLRRSKRSKLSKSKKTQIVEQQISTARGLRDAEIRGRGDKRISEMIREIQGL